MDKQTQLLGMSQVWTEGLESGNLCTFCTLNPSQMISQALYDKYTYIKNSQYLKSTDQIVEGQKITPATVAFLEWQFLEDDEETLKRYYYDFEYAKRSHRFGEYYEHHREFPRFSDVEIYKIKRKHSQKLREYQYKLVKRLLNDNHQSVSENTKTQNEDENSKQTEVDNVLRDIQQEQSELEQSKIFVDIVGELKELTKGKEESFQLNGDFYEKKPLGTGLEVYLQKIGKKKKKFQNSIISTERKYPIYKKRVDADEDKNTFREQPRIIRNFSGNNLLFKFQRYDQRQSNINSLSRTKSTFNIAKTSLWLNKEAKLKSVQKIYGKQSKYASIDSKHSDSQINPQNEGEKRISFRINQIAKKADNKGQAVKPTVFKFVNKSKIKRENKILSIEQQTIETNNRVMKLTQRNPSPVKLISNNAAVDKQCKTLKKLDIVKVYKKIKGIL